MEHFKRFWYYVLIEPYTWMFYSTFQPTHFKQEMEPAIFTRHAALLEPLRYLVPTRWKGQFDHLHVLRNIVPSLRLWLPLFLVFYVALFLIQVVPYAFFPALNPDFYAHELATSHIFDVLLKMAEYAAIGVGFGIFSGCLFGIKAGTVLGVTGELFALEAAIITTTDAIDIVAIFFTTFCCSIGFLVASAAEGFPPRISAGSAIGTIIGIAVAFGSEKIINPSISYGMGYLVGFAEKFVLATAAAFGFSLIVASVLRIVHRWLKRSALTDTFIGACTIAAGCSAGYIFGANPLWLFLCFSIVIGVPLTYLAFNILPSHGSSEKVGLIAGACLGIIGGTFLASLFAYQHSMISSELSLGSLLLAIPLGIGTAFAIRALIGNTLRLRRDVAICLGVCVTLSIGTPYSTSLLMFLGYLIGCYRIPFYPVSFFSGLKAYLNSLHTPSMIFTNLHQTSLHWDERLYLPYPFLMPLLLIAAEQNSESVWQEIAYITTQRPQQTHVARAVALKLIIRELETQKNLTAIASMAPKLAEVLSASPDLFDALSLVPLTYIKEACTYAEECCRSTQRSTKQEALEQMTERLQKIQPQTMFRRALWTRHLDRLIHDWLKIIQSEQAKLGNYQTWVDLKKKIESSQEVIGIAAVDFIALVDSAYANDNRWNRPKRLSELLAGVKESEDFELLAKIISVIYLAAHRGPYGWMVISCLRKHSLRDDIEDEFDAERAAEVLNCLYRINPENVSFAMIDLRDTIEIIGDHTNYRDLVRRTGKLIKGVLMMTNPIKIFISYAREDQEKAERLRADLERQGFFAWKDTHEILPGENFEQKIAEALEKADCAILCFSEKAVIKKGFVQVEVKEALRLQQHRPDMKIFIIPVRFDNCQLPFDLRRQKLHYTDLFPDWNAGFSQVVRAINHYFSPNSEKAGMLVPVFPSNTLPEPTVPTVSPDPFAPTISLTSPATLSEAPYILPCGHELRTPGARFCSVCGVPISS